MSPNMMNLSAPEFIPSSSIQTMVSPVVSPSVSTYSNADKPPSLSSFTSSSTHKNSKQKNYVHGKANPTGNKYKNSPRKGNKTTLVATGPMMASKNPKKTPSKMELLEEELTVFEQPTVDSLLTSPNKRGLSLTHLLNFSFPPRQTYTPSGIRKKSSSYNFFNKERFVNANYRFVMKEDGDYTHHLVDPDRPVPWEDVLQVVMPTSNHITCPICLHEPIAAKVTKCGHVYCWHCLHQYLNMSSSPADASSHKKWKKCPICYDAVYLKDVKSVKIVPTQDICKSSGSSKKERILPTPERPTRLKMTLMKRALLSTLALPRNGYQDWENELIAMGKPLKRSDVNHTPGIPPNVNNIHAMLFSKLLVATPEYHLEMLLKEKRELENILSELFIEQSNNPVLDDEKQYVDACLEELKPLVSDAQVRVQVSQNLAKALSTQEKKSLKKKSSFTSELSRAIQESQQASSPSGPPDFYYFYQASDGQHLFLHPLDIKILKHEFKEYSKFPDRIDVDVIYLSESTMDEDLRKRCKYLEHLPLTCDVGFVEIDWRGVVSVETIDLFSKETGQRLAKRAAKEKKEEQERKRQQQKQDLIDKQLSGMTGGYFIPMSPSTSEPTYSAADSLQSEENFPPIAIISSSPGGTMSEASAWAGPSFARIASSPTFGGHWQHQQHRQSTSGRYRVLYNANSVADDDVTHPSNCSDVDELHGEFVGQDEAWTLDLGHVEDAQQVHTLMDDLALQGEATLPAPKKKKNKSKGIVVVSNGGLRGRS